MKIAIVNQHPTDMLGGSEIQCDIIARTLVEFGHEVDYIAVGGHDCDAYEVPYRVRPVARQAKAIAEQVIAAKPDDAQAYNALGYSLADRGLRLAEAKVLLLNKQITIAQIAYQLKFTDPSHFGKFFKSQTEQSPLMYRNQI